MSTDNYRRGIPVYVCTPVCFLALISFLLCPLLPLRLKSERKEESERYRILHLRLHASRFNGLQLQNDRLQSDFEQRKMKVEEDYRSERQR